MLNKDNNFLIYGFGNLGKKVYELLSSNGVKTIAIMDNGIQLTNDIEGYSIFQDQINESFIVVISIWNPLTNLKTLISDLRNKFPSNTILFAGELTNYFKFDHFLFVSREFLREKQDIIQETRDLLIDNKSKNIFDELISLRMSNSFDKDLIIDESQYLPSDLPEVLQKIENSIFCDIGAYTGDTLLDFANKIESFKYIGFEPDLANYNELSMNLQKLKIDGLAINKATGSFNGSVEFEQGNGVSSKIIAHLNDGVESSEVEIVKLDDFSWEEIPTIFKMDIEGAERDTLIGMEEIIKSTKPLLMICLYHTKDDLWEIPRMIFSWRSDYNFSIRQHAKNGLETVLYCY